MDRSGPRHERWDHDHTEWWREGDPAFFADDAAHGLGDALDRWPADHPDVRSAS